MPTDALLLLSEAVLPSPGGGTESPSEDAIRPLLVQEVGYEVVWRAGRSRASSAPSSPGRRRWGGPFAGAARRPSRGGSARPRPRRAALVLLAIGEYARQARPPPTVAVAQVVHGLSGVDEAAVGGLAAVYRPASGPAAPAAAAGSWFDLDLGGVEGQTHRFVLDDRDAWHWESLDLPAGVRTARISGTVPLAAPLVASAHFDADGLAGTLAAGPFQDLADGVLTPPQGRALGVRFGPDGAFPPAGRTSWPRGAVHRRARAERPTAAPAGGLPGGAAPPRRRPRDPGSNCGRGPRRPTWASGSPPARAGRRLGPAARAG